MSTYTKSEVLNHVYAYEQLVDDAIDRLKLAAQTGEIDPPPGMDPDAYRSGMADGMLALLREISPFYGRVSAGIPS